MKSLVIGANGLLGANLARHLLAEGHAVRALVREGSDRRALNGLGVEIVVGDVLDRDSLRTAAEGQTFVFHCATPFEYWGVSDEALMDLALRGVSNAIDAAHDAGTRRVVLTSSTVTLGSSTEPVVRTESDELADPEPPAYVLAKAAQERLAVERAAAVGVELVTACPGVAVGPHGVKLGPSNRVIVNYLADPFKTTFPGGCNLVSVADVAAGHLLLALHGAAGERYVLGGENLPWAQLHRTISELCGINGPLVTTSHTGAYLVATAAELAARLRGRSPATTRAEAKMVGRYYWYSHDNAAA